MTCSQEMTTLLTLDELIKTMKNVFTISDTRTLGELALFQRLAELTQARVKMEMLAELTQARVKMEMLAELTQARAKLEMLGEQSTLTSRL